MQKAKAVDPSSGSRAEHRQAQPLSWEVGDLGTSPQPCPSVLWRFRGHWRHHALRGPSPPTQHLWEVPLPARPRMEQSEGFWASPAVSVPTLGDP